MASKKLLLFIILLSISSGSFAQWTWNLLLPQNFAQDGSGVPIVGLVTGNQDQQQMTVTQVHDGIVYVWRDTRTGSVGQDIWAQKTDPCGNPLWGATGLLLCNATSNQQFPQVVNDANNGAIFVWQDTRGLDFDIYAKRINGNGTTAWGGANGLAICTLATDQLNPQMCPDGSGGAIITWEDSRNANIDIYASRVTSAGALPWGASGIPICTAVATQDNESITTDSLGGAVISWEDSRTSGATGIDVYAQRVDGAGVVQWAANGIVISNLTSNQINISSCNTMGNTVTICFADGFGAGQGISAVKLNSNGTGFPGWTFPGGNNVGNAITASGNPGTASFPVIAPDCSGGCFIPFRSNYAAGDHDVLTSWVNSSGVVIGFNYTAFNTDIESNERIAPDNLAGSWIAYDDAWPPKVAMGTPYNGSQFGGSYDILAMGNNSRDLPSVCAMRGVGYFAWLDRRPASLGTMDLFAGATSSLAPAPELLSSVTTRCLCCTTIAVATICLGDPVTFTTIIPGGIFTTYTFYDGATVIQSGASPVFNTSALTAGAHNITVTSTAGTCISAPSNIIQIIVVNPPTAPCSPLPIELLSFDGHCDQGSVLLTWSTATESNNNYFAIERTRDGTNYDVIATVSGSGSSTETRNYSYIDSIPFEGTAYYRLRQVDYNGNFMISNPVAVEKCAPVQEFFNVFSDQNNIYVAAVASQETNYAVSVMDAEGRLIIKKDFEAYTGENHFLLNDCITSTGIYMVTITGSNGSVYAKKVYVMKQ